MRGNPEVIAQLNVALREELTAINQYFLHAEMCHSWGYHQLGAYIKKQSIDEMKHAEKLIADLRSRFDFVVIDASPLLPVTDAAVLAVKVDGALVVVRHGQTKKEQVTRAVGNLRSVGATVLGTILTMTPSKGKGAYEYSYYYDSDAPVQKIESPATQVSPAPLPVQAGKQVQ